MSDWLTDPGNRWVHYPLSRIFLPTLLKTRISANQITALHTLVGLSAGGLLYWHGLHASLPIFFLYELRSMLDCLDGMVARARKTASQRGKFYDGLADTVSFIAFCSALYFDRVETGVSNHQIWLIFFSVATSAAAYEFFRIRKVNNRLVLFLRSLTCGDNSVHVVNLGFLFEWLRPGLFVTTLDFIPWFVSISLVLSGFTLFWKDEGKKPS